MEHTYSFFVLRYVPDRDRGEQVNIGIVVDRSPLEVRVTRDLRKAIAIDARRGAADLLALEGQVREWIARTDDFGQAREALRFFSPITVSEIGWFKATQSDYEAHVDLIMRDLVTPPTRPAARLRSRLNTGMSQMLQRSNVLSTDPEDIRRHKVVRNYPISQKGKSVRGFRSQERRASDQPDDRFQSDRAAGARAQVQ